MYESLYVAVKIYMKYSFLHLYKPVGDWFAR